MKRLVRLCLRGGRFVAHAARHLRGMRIEKQRLVAHVPDEVQRLIGSPADHAHVVRHLEAPFQPINVDGIHVGQSQTQRHDQQQRFPGLIARLDAKFDCNLVKKCLNELPFFRC